MSNRTFNAILTVGIFLYCLPGLGAAYFATQNAEAGLVAAKPASSQRPGSSRR